MWNRRPARTYVVLCFLCVVITQRATAQGTSTSEERARWAEITHKLESSPLDEAVNKDGEWAFNRLSEVHDIHVPLCQGLLVEFNDSKYKYRHEITRQYMLASGAFLIENPGKGSDINAMNVAAVESVLKVYDGILKQKSDAKSKVLDDLLNNQGQGKLDDALRKQCK
jgi:carboxypeptidase Q